MKTPPPSVRVLRDEYARRKARNARYSLRSFSRDLGMSQSLLSQILNGKRALTLKQSAKAAAAVAFSKRDRRVLLGGAFPEPRGPARMVRARASRYESPEFVRTARDFDLHWTETAVFALTFMRDFRADVNWIARKLGISRELALDALEALERKALVRYDGERLVRTHRKLYYDSTTSVKHVRRYCQDMMAKASAELARTDAAACARRAIQGYTLAIDPARIPEAKRKVATFLQELSDFLTAGEATALYQLNFQVFPLTD